MKFTDYILSFFLIFGIAFILVNYKTSLNAEASVMETKYKEYAKTACLDAMKQVSSPPSSGEGVFANEKKRKEVIDTYMTSIAYSLNAKNTTYEEEIMQYVPVICLIDQDGYYISYTAKHADEQGYARISHVLTPLNAWGENITDETGKAIYQIRYYLNDYVAVTEIESGIYKEGDPLSVYAFFSSPNLLSFLTDTNALYERKSHVITQKTMADVEYYINRYNNTLEEYGLSYAFEIPEIKGEDWGRALESPTILGFLQGHLVQNGDNMINVYAMAGAQLTRTKIYYATNDMLYHETKNCSAIQSDIQEVFYSDIECAKNGYYPCKDCTE